jgi:hypothetical protein
MVRPWLAAALAATLLGSPALAAKLPQTTPQGLVLQPNTKLSAVYLAPGTNLANYDRYALVDAFVEFKKGYMDEQNEDIPFSVSKQWMDQTTAELAVEFKKQFTKVMSQKGGFQQSTMTGPDVMVLRPAIVNLDITAPDTMQPGVTSFVSSAGSMTLYLEVYDSMSNKLIAQIYDAESGEGDGRMSWATGPGNLQAADYVIDQWANTIRRALERAREAAGESPDGPPPGTAAPTAVPTAAPATPPKPTSK